MTINGQRSAACFVASRDRAFATCLFFTLDDRYCVQWAAAAGCKVPACMLEAMAGAIGSGYLEYPLRVHLPVSFGRSRLHILRVRAQCSPIIMVATRTLPILDYYVRALSIVGGRKARTPDKRGILPRNACEEHGPGSYEPA